MKSERGEEGHTLLCYPIPWRRPCHPCQQRKYPVKWGGSKGMRRNVHTCTIHAHTNTFTCACTAHTDTTHRHTHHTHSVFQTFPASACRQKSLRLGPISGMGEGLQHQWRQECPPCLSGICWSPVTVRKRSLKRSLGCEPRLLSSSGLPSVLD